MNKKIIMWSVIGFFTLSIAMTGCWGISKNIDTDNTEVDLSTAIVAKKSDQEATVDNMWKIISGKAQVATQYKDAFYAAVPQLVEGRKGAGEMMKWITESNPTFDVSLYKDVMASIDIERNAFLTVQRQLMDLKREHDKLRKRWPSKWFINDDVKELETMG